MYVYLKEEGKISKFKKTEISKKDKEKKISEIGKVKPRKRWKKIVIFILMLIVLAGVSWFGYKVYIAAKKIFEKGPSLGLLNYFNPKELKGERDGRVNFLLLGIGGEGWAGGNLTDTIMVVSVDTKKNNVAMISIPRDLYVEIDDYGYNRINAAHAYGEQYEYEGGGPALAKATVSDVLGIPIHYYIRVDFEGFEKIISTLGGITVTVEEDLYDPFYPSTGGYSVVAFEEGIQEMNGEEALKFARSRETTSDFDRAKRQQKILVAVKEKALSLDTLLNPKKLSELIDILGDHIKTDLEIEEMYRAMNLAKEVNTGTIINKVLDNSQGGFLISGNIGGMYVLSPKGGEFNKIQKFAKNIFSEIYLKDENATLEISNGTYRSGLASRVAEDLETLNLNVSEISDAKRHDYKESVIYDYTGGQKPYTASYLADYFDAKVEGGLEEKKGIDFRIIIGKDFKE